MKCFSIEPGKQQIGPFLFPLLLTPKAPFPAGPTPHRSRPVFLTPARCVVRPRGHQEEQAPGLQTEQRGQGGSLHRMHQKRLENVGVPGKAFRRR